MAAQGSNLVLAIKKQAGGLGVPETGSGAFGIEVRPSTGLAQAVATIQSQRLRRSLMHQRPRQGSISVSAAYETELQVGEMDLVFAGVLGGAAVPSFTLTEASASLGSVTIAGTGTTITNGGGSWLTSGIRRGMMIKFADLATSANNGVWVPVLDVTAGVITVASGYLVDQAIDTGFSLITAKYIATETPYAGDYYTVEEYLSDVGFSKYGSDMKFNALNFAAAANQDVTVGFGLAGRKLEKKATQQLTDPTFNAQSGPSSLVLLDGNIYVDGVENVDLTGFTFGIQSPATFLPMLSTRYSPDAFLGMFDFTGQFTGAITDDSFFDAFLAETRMSIFARMAERESDPADFVSVYIGDAAPGGWNAPIADGPLIQTIPLYAGEDGRGGASLASTFVISTSAA